MIDIEVSCSMCGKEAKISLSNKNADPGKSLRRIIEDFGWRTQLNEPYFDIYCSKQCAE